MTGKRRHRLVQRRKAVGLSQESLAEALGVDRSTVARWERAETEPQPWRRPRLAATLRVSVEELADLLAEPRPIAAEPAVFAHPRPGQRIGDPAALGVDDLDTVRSFRKADRQFGGAHLYATVTSYLERAVAPRLFGRAPDRDEQVVFAAAASLTEMAGWMAHDSRRDSLAEQHFRRASSLALIARDHHLAAHVSGSLSHLAHHTRQPERAIAYAQQGREHLNRGEYHPALEARLLALRARSHAATGDQERCLDDLRRAERALTRTPEAASSPWASGYDEASLAVDAARCLRHLGHHDAARSQAEQAISLRPPQRVRSRALAQLILVSILTARRRPEEACAVAVDIVTSTRALGSALVATQLAHLARQLAPYRTSPQVRDVLQHLHDELRERRWMAEWLPADADPTNTGLL